MKQNTRGSYSNSHHFDFKSSNKLIDQDELINSVQCLYKSANKSECFYHLLLNRKREINLDRHHNKSTYDRHDHKSTYDRHDHKSTYDRHHNKSTYDRHDHKSTYNRKHHYDQLDTLSSNLISSLSRSESIEQNDTPLLMPFIYYYSPVRLRSPPNKRRKIASSKSEPICTRNAVLCVDHNSQDNDCNQSLESEDELFHEEYSRLRNVLSEFERSPLKYWSMRYSDLKDDLELLLKKLEQIEQDSELLKCELAALIPLSKRSDKLSKLIRELDL